MTTHAMERGTLWIRKDVRVRNRGNAVPYPWSIWVFCFYAFEGIAAVYCTRCTTTKRVCSRLEKKKEKTWKKNEPCRPSRLRFDMYMRPCRGRDSHIQNRFGFVHFWFWFCRRSYQCGVEAASPQRGGPLHDYLLLSRARL